DNRGNTYTRIAEVVNSTSGDHGAIFWARVANNTTPFTVTSSVSGTIAAHEYSNVATSSPLDKVASATGSSKTPNSGSVTTTNDHDLFVGLSWSGTNGDTWSSSAGYTLRENETNNNTAERIATEDQVITTGTTTAAIFSVPTSDQWLAMIGAFRPATSTS